MLPGATGTLLELAWVWEATAKRFLQERPIVCLGDFWRPLIDLMTAAQPACARYVAVAKTPADLAKHFQGSLG